MRNYSQSIHLPIKRSISSMCIICRECRVINDFLLIKLDFSDSLLTKTFKTYEFFKIQNNFTTKAFSFCLSLFHFFLRILFISVGANPSINLSAVISHGQFSHIMLIHLLDVGRGENGGKLLILFFCEIQYLPSFHISSTFIFSFSFLVLN